MPNFQIVSAERHGMQRWNWRPDYRFAAHRPFVPLYAGELGRAVGAMPVAFIEETGRYSLVALTSLLPNNNYFVDAGGKWRGRYIPVSLRLHPFRLLRSSASGVPVLCIDEDGGALVPASQPGFEFFAPDGRASPALQQVIDELTKLEAIERQTEAAVAALAKAGIIRPWPIKFDDGKGGFKDVVGLHCVDEGALNVLDDAAFSALRQPMTLAIAYGQLYSTNQLSFLLELGRSNITPSDKAVDADASGEKPSAPADLPSAATSPAPPTSKISKASQRKISSLYDQGHRLMGANRLGKAEGIFRRVLELDAGHAESWHMLAAIAVQTGRMDDAAAMSAKAVALKPKFPAAHFNLGLALAARNDPEGAIASYERALALKPDYADALVNLGSALLLVGRAEEALVRYEQALSLKAKSPTTLFNLGNALDILGRKDEAIDRYRQALALKPDYVEALSNLGGILGRQGKMDEAVACYERALSIRPGMSEVLNNLSLALLDKGRVDPAVNHCLAALRHSGLSVPASVNDAVSLEGMMSGLPSDHAFTPHQEQYLTTLLLCYLSEHGIADWSGLVEPLRRFKWSAEMDFNMLVPQEISHWTRGDLANRPTIVAEADRALGQLNNVSGQNFLANRAYHNFLKKILRHASRRSTDQTTRPIATIIGDSHGLSYTGQDVEIGGLSYLTKAELVMGAKAWHLATDAPNRYKHRFEWVIARVPEHALILCSFGEIDCRVNGGILPFYRKSGGNLDDIVRRQTTAYVAYVRDRLLVRRQTPLFLGVPAPFMDSPDYDREGATSEDEKLLVEIIRLFNESLKQAASAEGFGFVDLYALTNDCAGKASGRLHNDSIHLKPEALALALALDRERSSGLSTHSASDALAEG